ncbi:MAG TPA: hypothetical protein VFV73_21610 [Streptosporangiaceae bacterium]|nr:hypothetical protein [Streptosporangiaceae bacterium]
MAAVVPPAPVPLSFLAASVAGLVGCGVSLAWACGLGMTDPGQPPGRLDADGLASRRPRPARTQPRRGGVWAPHGGNRRDRRRVRGVAVGTGGGLLAVAGIGLAASLAARPLRMLRRPGPASAMAPGRSTPSS